MQCPFATVATKAGILEKIVPLRIWRIRGNSNNNGGGSMSDSIFTDFKGIMSFKTPLQMESEFILELHKSCDTKLTPEIGEIERI